MTELLLNKSYLDEVRRSLRPEFDAGRLTEMTAEPEIYRYRDALAALTADVADQLERRDELIQELARAAVQTTEMERELSELKGWKKKAQGFRRHVAQRSREVNATIRELNRSRDYSIATLKARVEELEAVLRMVRADRPTAHSDAVWLAVCTALAEDVEKAAAIPVNVSQNAYDVGREGYDEITRQARLVRAEDWQARERNAPGSMDPR